MKMQYLAGKVAFITGASSGIGEATARALAAEGVHVVLAARRIDRIKSLAQELGDQVSVVPLDVRDPVQVKQAFDYVRDTFGGLDLLLNNAGRGIHSSFAESTREQWVEMIDTNLKGLLECTHAAIPLMKSRPGAMIASISSTGGRYGVERWSVYCATKYAVVGFHETLRKELGADGIRVTVIEPGAVWTEFGENISKEVLHERRRQLEALQPEDVAQSVVYAFAQPPHVLVQEILVRPVKQLAP